MPSARDDTGSDNPNVVVLRGTDRYLTRTAGTTTRHCFSYGDHYDPANTGFGVLRAVNEELVDPGSGYDTHRHADIEIVTWVLDGVLEHEDSAGNRGTVRPGDVQYLSAGSGVDHAERNASETEPLRFVQMMLSPSDAALGAPPLPPVYRQHELAGTRGRLLPALTVRDGVELYVALLDPDDEVAVPYRGDAHLHLTRGAVLVDGLRPLGPGDTVRIAGSDAPTVRAEQRAELLVWHLR